jgi:hypothetical protein
MGEPTGDRLIRIHALLDDLTSSPWSHDILELALGTALSLGVSKADETALVWLLIVGAPSDGKTFVLLLLKDAEGIYWLDSVTENFLASAYLDEKTGKRAPDLFHELDNSCVAIKELGTVFSLRADKVRKFLGDLQALYDGEYHKATGTLGTIRGRATFSMAACVTPATLHEHHEYMARIGPRFLMLRLPELSEATEDEGLAMLWEGDRRRDHIVLVRNLVRDHLQDCRRLTLDPEPETPRQRETIGRLAQLVACGRTSVRRQAVIGKNGKTRYEREIAQREGPYRVQQQLRNLARGLALAHGRSRVTDHELELVRRVAVSSLPADRADVVRLFPAHPEGLTVDLCAAGIGKSKDRARQLLAELVLIGLLDERRGTPTGGAAPFLYVPVPRFSSLVSAPTTPTDHALDLAENFADTTDTAEGGDAPGQCYQESSSRG